MTINDIIQLSVMFLLLIVYSIFVIKDNLKVECEEGYKKGLGRKHVWEEVSFRKWCRTGNLGFGINVPFRVDIKYRCKNCGKEYIKDYE